MTTKDILNEHRVLRETVEQHQKTLENLVFHPSGLQVDLDGFRGMLMKFVDSVAALDRFLQREWGSQ